MRKGRPKRYRLSIDLASEEHYRIKLASTVCHETISSYVLDAVRSQVERDLTTALSATTDPVLAELWNNEKDSEYDKL